MEFLLSLPKTLLDLSVSLLKIKKDDRSRQRLADLLSAVARCVSDIGDAIEGGIHPTKLCAELDTYIANVESLVSEHVGDATAARMALWLRHVADVPGIARIDVTQVVEMETKPRWTNLRRHEHAEQVRQIAGLIEGTANLIRV